MIDPPTVPCAAHSCPGMVIARGQYGGRILIVRVRDGYETWRP
jgi:hypothetical protein